MLLFKDTKQGLNSLAFSPDGKWLAAGGYRGNVLLWNLTTGKFAGKQRGCEQNVNTVFFAGDELFGLEVRWPMSPPGLYSWELTPGGEPRPRPPREKRQVYGATVSPDERHLCLLFDKELQCLSLPDYKLIWRDNIRLGPVVCSADGRWFTHGENGGKIVVTDAETRGLSRTVTGNSEASQIEDVALSPDGQLIALCAATHLHLWRLDPLERIVDHSLGGRTHFLAVAFHPSGDFFATANGDGKVDFWDAQTGVRRHSFDWGIGKLHDVAFDATGDRAACCGKSGEVVVWDVD